MLNTPIFQLSMGVASVCLLWFGGQMIMAGVLGVGTLTGFMSYVLLIMNSLKRDLFSPALRALPPSTTTATSLFMA